MACRLLALDKAPVFSPVVNREIICHLLSKCVIFVTGAIAIKSCVNIKLCSGLGYHIEGDVHTTLEEYRKYQFPSTA